MNLYASNQLNFRQSSESENYLTSVERVLEYAKLVPERSRATDPVRKKVKFNRKVAKAMLNDIMNNQQLEATSSENGNVTFKNFKFNYYEDGPIILKGLNLQIQSGEKVGVVGRTGAGKSSLISALFRVNNGIDGLVEVNDRDIGTVRVWKDFTSF